LQLPAPSLLSITHDAATIPARLIEKDKERKKEKNKDKIRINTWRKDEFSAD